RPAGAAPASLSGGVNHFIGGPEMAPKPPSVRAPRRSRGAPLWGPWPGPDVPRLLLEEIVEGAADVAWARGVRRGVALDRHAQREPFAFVARVLVGQPLGDGLFALEVPARIEMAALLAGVEGGAAVRALGEGRDRDGQDGAARCAPGHGVLGQHLVPARRL